MREYLFRGKRIDGSGWVEGDLVQRRLKGKVLIGHIADGYKHYLTFVDPATIGQFTGLLDKNGKKIFEGDILGDGTGQIYGMVEWDTNLMQWAIKYPHDNGTYGYYPMCEIGNGDYGDEPIVVVGNRRDNPELLGGAE